MKPAHLASLVIAGLALAPASARANGRFPDAQQLVVDPGDGNHIAVQTTYGFIVTRNGGDNWTWSCEQAASYSGILDPPIAIVDGGVLLAAVFDGLSVTSPDGCDYAFVGGDLADRFFVDVSTLKQDATRAIALSSDGLGGNTFDTQVFKSTDAAGSWQKHGVALPPSFLGFTLDAALDDEELIYLSGFDVITSSSYVGSLAVTTDGGATWALKPIPGSENDSGPYIAAIDPNDHDTLYVRLDSLEGVLLVTHDQGDTWETIFEGQGSLLGFALSPDGSEVRVGGDVDGIWGASTADFEFTLVNDASVRCLTWTGDALFACGREALDEFTVAKSFDGGTTFEAIHHLSCLDGPDPACAAGTTIADECTGPWAAQQQIIQTDLCEPAVGGAGAGGGGAGGAPAGDDSDDGCSCRAVAPATPWRGGAPGLAFLALAGLSLAARVTRRR
jgi:hypothetical protein